MHDASEPDNAAELKTFEKATLQTVAYKHIRELVTHTLKPFKLNTTQWMILGVLHEQPTGQKISSIAHDLQVEVPLITTLTQPLQKAGYVEQRLNANDRRSKPLVLSDSGRQLMDVVETELVVKLRLIETGIDPKQLADYFATLRQLIGNAERIESAG